MMGCTGYRRAISRATSRAGRPPRPASDVRSGEMAPAERSIRSRSASVTALTLAVSCTAGTGAGHAAPVPLDPRAAIRDPAGAGTGSSTSEVARGLASHCSGHPTRISTTIVAACIVAQRHR